jgi:hypothetical protein
VPSPGNRVFPVASSFKLTLTSGGRLKRLAGGLEPKDLSRHLTGAHRPAAALDFVAESGRCSPHRIEPGVFKGAHMEFVRFQPSRDIAFEHLSLRDLLDARDLYHLHLMNHPRVIATAVGRYRIRRDDSWPNDRKVVHGTGARTLENSEVRPYSWPAVLVFVNEWVSADRFAVAPNHPSDIVPTTLYCPDGRRIPVCVIEAPRDPVSPDALVPLRHPLNNIGGGSQVLVDVQGRRHAATVACLVSDGHTAYALTNRHVAGVAGQVVSAFLDGRFTRVGQSSDKQLTRLTFSEVYPGWPASDTYGRRRSTDVRSARSQICLPKTCRSV